ncbi:MAG: amino acid racemase [Gammaproteobacteria bacterium]|nr:amino acid racemase [Gammaproteobacteria bacterium]
MTGASLGILTGISYISGLDYFESINRLVTEGSSIGHLMPPNPEIVMVSIDCDRYVSLLSSDAHEEVSQHLLRGVKKLVRAGCNLLVIASNTGHIGVPAIEKEFPDLGIVHIADCSAARIRESGFSKIGLIGTKPTMENNFLSARLRAHEVTTIVPNDPSARSRIYDIICQELSFNTFRNDSRDFMIGEIRAMADRGAQACLLGCTEIELLIQQEHIPEVPLLPSAQIHTAEIADILLGRRQLEDLLPATSLPSPT